MPGNVETPSGLWCKNCGPAFPLRIEMRLVAKPLTYSISGMQNKIAASEWPYAVCDNCKSECRGKTA